MDPPAQSHCYSPFAFSPSSTFPDDRERRDQLDRVIDARAIDIAVDLASSQTIEELAIVRVISRV
jgi:hypothetical protein